ncbi:MAG: hypothetical protein OHK0023_00960 [Anaerolineae bacterium]
MSIRTRLIIAFCVISLLLLMARFYINTVFQNIQRQYEALTTQIVPGTFYAINTQANLALMTAAAERTVSTGDARFWNEMLPYADGLRKSAAEHVEAETDLSDEEYEEALEIQEGVEQTIADLQKLVELAQTQASASEVARLRNVIAEEQAQLFEILNEDVETDSARLDQASLLLQQTLDNTSLLLAVFGFAAVLVIGLGGALFVIYAIFRPLGQFRDGVKIFGEGNLSHRITMPDTNEFGQLAKTFNMMAANLEQREQELRQSNEVKSAFLASMSHELRTPLNAIINYTKFVLRGMMGDVTEKQRDTLTKVVHSGQHLLNLINDVLDISKIESGSLTLFVEPDVNMNDLLNTAVDYAKSLLEDKPIELVTDIQPNMPLMIGDRKRVLQIVLNILSNACKYTEKGQITLHASEKDGQFKISVTDTGPGIAPEDRDAVFETFKQTKSGLRQGEGTGLGMPISLKLAQAHHGHVWFESTLGQGSTFYVTLPVHPEGLEVPTSELQEA